MRIPLTERDAVSLGAALLDAQMPGWAERIHLETLDISSFGQCVLAQLFSSYEEGVRVLALRDVPREWYGFCGWMYDGHAALQRAWIEAIEVRRGLAAMRAAVATVPSYCERYRDARLRRRASLEGD